MRYGDRLRKIEQAIGDPSAFCSDCGAPGTEVPYRDGTSDAECQQCGRHLNHDGRPVAALHKRYDGIEIARV